MSRRPTQPAIVALTGGIASGKTAVSDRLRELGVPVVDTDVIAREVVAAGSPLLARIVAYFGPGVQLPDGTLDRRALRERIFSDDAARAALEDMMHPAILLEAKRRIAGLATPYAVVVIPLLAEGGGHDWIDRVLVVDTPETTQMDRLMARDGVTAESARAALAAQATRQERLAIADDVIENISTLSDLEAATDRMHERYTRRFAPPENH